MRSLKTLCLTLVVLLLVPCFAIASPSTWVWLQSSQPSESLEVPAETSVEEPVKLTVDSANSKATSKSVKMVTIPEDIYLEALAQIEEGNASNKKGGDKVDEAKAMLEESAKKVKERSLHYTFGATGDWKLDGGFKLGIEAGLILKETLYVRAGIMKDDVCDFTNLADMNGYTMNFGIGWVF